MHHLAMVNLRMNRVPKKGAPKGLRFLGHRRYSQCRLHLGRGLKIRTVDGEEKTIRMVDPEEILLISDERPPEHEQYGIGENTVINTDV